jgi:hypothetical protein
MRFAALSRALLPALAAAATLCAADFRAGAGKSDIRTSSEMWPVDGFTSEHDALAVRVLLLDDGRARFAIAVLDQTSLNDGTISFTKGRLKELAAVPPDNTIVIASHTFSAPHAFGGGGRGPEPSPGTVAYSKAIDAAVESAARQALASLQPARIGFGAGKQDIAVNRDVPTPRGWWLGADAAGFSDTALPVIRIDAVNGKPLAVLLNAAVQPSIMDHSENKDGSKPVTADLAGAATHFVEQRYGGNTVAFFLVGAAGDQAPVFQGNRYVLNSDGSTSRIDIHEAGFTLVDLIGERLGSETIQAAESIRPDAAPSIEIWRRSVQVPSQAGSRGLPTEPVLSYTYQPGPEVEAPVVLMRIGDIALVGIRPELAAGVGAEIKAKSPFAHTIVVTMVDGGAKYMPTADSYERFTYEARNSSYGRGAAETLAAGVISLLKQMKEAAGK